MQDQRSTSREKARNKNVVQGETVEKEEGAGERDSLVLAEGECDSQEDLEEGEDDGSASLMDDGDSGSDLGSGGFTRGGLGPRQLRRKLR